MTVFSLSMDEADAMDARYLRGMCRECRTTFVRRSGAVSSRRCNPPIREPYKSLTAECRCSPETEVFQVVVDDGRELITWNERKERKFSRWWRGWLQCT